MSALPRLPATLAGAALRDVRHDLAVTWRAGGLGALREAILWRTSHRLYRRQSLLLVEQDLSSVHTAPPPAGIELRALGPADWDRLAGSVTTRTAESFRRRAADGRWGVSAWRGERAVGFAWNSARIDREHEYLPLALPSGVLYCWGLWVTPAERNRGVGHALAHARLEEARDRGFERAWRLIEPGNHPSWRVLEKMDADGLRIVHRVTFSTVLGRTRARYEPPGPAASELVRGSGST